MNASEWQTVDEIVDDARATLAGDLWDGLCGGAGRETTLRRNEAAFRRIALVPRVLRPVAEVDLRTPFLGRTLDLPILLAPIGEIARFHADGAAACAAAASGAGTGAFVSVVSSPSLEEVRARSTNVLVFQLYVFGDREWLRRIVARATEAGYDAICLTVDTPVSGRKERDLRNRLSLPPQPRPNLDGGELPAYEGGSLEWDDVAWLRKETQLPLILKGVLHPDDAALAVEHGVDVVHVSNHGGQQLDDAPSTIEMLPEILAAVAGRADVVVDSGFDRGTDVIKALALGASAVAIGRLAVMALAAGGEEGVRRLLSILEAELKNGLVNLGVGSVAALGPEYLRETTPA